MVAMLLLPGVAGQTGSQGGADRGQESAAVNTFVSQTEGYGVEGGGCSENESSDLTLGVMVISVFVLKKAQCAQIISLCTETSCCNFHKPATHS